MINFRVTIIEINTEGGIMTNWIDNLRNNVQEKVKTKQRQEELQLYKAQIIKGKLPVFWRDLEECVAAYCIELREKIPDNKECHCTKHPIANGFMLVNDAYSLRKLSVRLDAGAQFIEVLEEVSEKPRYSPTGESGIKVSITNDDRLVLQWKGQNYFTPEELSEALVKPFVLDAVKR